MNEQRMPDPSYGLTPIVPGHAAIGPLRDQAFELAQKSANLNGRLQPATARAIGQLLTFMNSYYSNKIEGQGTHPIEIEAAFQRQRTEQHPESLIDIALAVAKVEQALPDMVDECDGKIASVNFVQSLHQAVYERLPEDYLNIKDPDNGKIIGRMEPGQLRERDVQVGRHIAYAAEHVPNAMRTFERFYQLDSVNGDSKLILAAAAHHRLAWIHPFLDGNGRVGRLHTHAQLIACLEHKPLWSLARGLARTKANYYAALHNADAERQGDFDGRGARSEHGLVAWIQYVLSCALDQVDYMTKILDLDGYRRRLEKFVTAAAESLEPDLPVLHPKSLPVLFAAFSEGGIERGAVTELTGLKDRMTRNIVSQLLDAGLLSSETHRSRLLPQFPTRYAESLFPKLGPQAAM